MLHGVLFQEKQLLEHPSEWADVPYGHSKEVDPVNPVYQMSHNILTHLCLVGSME